MKRKHKKINGYSQPRNPELYYVNLFPCREVEITDGYKVRMIIRLPENKEKTIEVTKKQISFLGTETVNIPEYLCRRLGI